MNPHGNYVAVMAEVDYRTARYRAEARRARQRRRVSVGHRRLIPWRGRAPKFR